MEEILKDETIISFINYKTEICEQNSLDVWNDEDYNRLLDFPGYIDKLAEIKRYFNDFRDFFELDYWDDDTFHIENMLMKLEI